MASSRRGADPKPVEPPRRTFVLDTSVVLADPRAPMRFAEHEVVLPVVVITELEAKRHHPELGYFARQALRLLDDLRVRHGRLDAPIPVGDDGRHAAGRAQPRRRRPAPGGLPVGRQRHPHPRGRAQSRRRRAARHGRQQGPPDARQGVCRGARRRGVRPRRRRSTRLDRHDGGRGRLADADRPLRRAGGRARRRPPTCPATPGSSCSPSAGRRSGASSPTSRSASSAATATSSACTAAAPSSASRSTSCSTPTSGSCPWAAGPAPASRRWRSAPAWRP